MELDSFLCFCVLKKCFYNKTLFFCNYFITFGNISRFFIDRNFKYFEFRIYMKRKSLLLISLFLSAAGIVALFFLKPDVSPQLLQMDGEVKYVAEKEKVTFISFVPENFTVVTFEKLDIEPGKHTLNGRLQQYKGRVEFIVESYD